MTNDLLSVIKKIREDMFIKIIRGDSFSSNKKASIDFSESTLKHRLGYTNTLVTGGMRVIEEPLPPPKLKLRDHIQVTDEVRESINAYLLAEFGRKKQILGKSEYLVSKTFGIIIAPVGGASWLTNISA